jgi:hypothetical protein
MNLKTVLFIASSLFLSATSVYSQAPTGKTATTVTAAKGNATPVATIPAVTMTPEDSIDLEFKVRADLLDKAYSYSRRFEMKSPQKRTVDKDVVSIRMDMKKTTSPVVYVVLRESTDFSNKTRTVDVFGEGDTLLGTWSKGPKGTIQFLNPQGQVTVDPGTQTVPVADKKTGN